jgi:hypothetical protein
VNGRLMLSLGAFGAAAISLARLIPDWVDGSTSPISLIGPIPLIAAIVLGTFVGQSIYASRQLEAVTTVRPEADAVAFIASPASWNLLSTGREGSRWYHAIGVLEVTPDALLVWRGTGYSGLVSTIPYSSISSVGARRIRDGWRRTCKLTLGLNGEAKHAEIAITIVKQRAWMLGSARPATVADLASRIGERVARERAPR